MPARREGDSPGHRCRRYGVAALRAVDTPDWLPLWRLETGGEAVGLEAASFGESRGSLPVYFDAVEICSGRSAPFSQACVSAALVVAPPVELKRQAFLDILRDDFFSWILDLVRAGRMCCIHLGPPCAIFSLAREPPLRSIHCPFGHDPHEEATRLGSVDAQLATAFELSIYVQLRRGMPEGHPVVFCGSVPL